MEESVRERTRSLVQKAIGGSIDAFEELYRLYGNTIHYQTRRYIQNPEEADDAAQKTVIEMYHSISSLANPGAFLPWMYRLTKFVCLRHIRDARFLRREYDVDVNEDEAPERFSDDRRDSNPADAAEAAERKKAVMRLIEKLPEKQREALVLHYYEGLTYREIALAIGGTIATVSTNIMKAKRHLARDIEATLTFAIAADAGLKLSGVKFAAFHSACHAAIVQLEPPASSAKTRKPAPNFPGALIAAVLVFAVLGGVLAAARKPPVEANRALPTAAAPAAIQAPLQPEPFLPASQILFADGICGCGHVNPLQAALDDIPKGVTEISWTILLPDGAELFVKLGDSAPIDKELMDGDYVMRCFMTNAAGARVILSRRFLIVHERPGNVIYL